MAREVTYPKPGEIPISMTLAARHASVSRGLFAVRLDYLYAPVGRSAAKDAPAGVKGEWLLSLNYTF